MALTYADRVKETTTTTGTGTLDLAGAETGFQGFVAGIGDGNTCYYCIADGTDWEVGIGTVTDAATDTLSRDTILASSNSGAAVDWSAGSKDVFVVLPAHCAPVVDGANDNVLLGSGASIGAGKTDNTVIGDGANVNGTDGVAIGRNADCAGSAFSYYHTAVGAGAKCRGSLYETAIGARAEARGDGSIAIGYQAETNNCDYAIAIGRGAVPYWGVGYCIQIGARSRATAANQCVIGSSDYPITDIYFDEGVDSSSPSGCKINASGGDGTDIAGGDLALAGGRGTGSADGGAVKLQYADAGSSGTSLNSLTTVITVDNNGIQIGEDTSRKVGFFGATPVVQPSTTGTTTGFTAGTGTAVNDDSTFTGNTGSTAYTVGDIVNALKTLGLLAD